MRLFSILVLLMASSVHATPLPDPPGLAPGAVYHRVFVTSNVFAVTTSNSYPPANFVVGGLLGADYQVTQSAFLAGMLPGWNGIDIPFHAILSDGTTNAKDRLDIEGPIYNMQNELIALNAADLWDGSLGHAIRYDESGNEVPLPGSDPLRSNNGWVWSGTIVGGTKDIDTAGNWLNPNTAASFGDPFSTSNTWINKTIVVANTSQHLYALSPPLTVVPEPSSMVLAAIGLAALIRAGLVIRR